MPTIQEMDHESTIFAYQTMLLSIYDEVFITDEICVIKSSAGQIEGLWDTQQDGLIGTSLLELEERFFTGDAVLKTLINKEESSALLTAWNNMEILVTAYPLKKEGMAGFAWGLTKVTDTLKTEIQSGGDVSKATKLSFPLIIKSKKMLEVYQTIQMVSKYPSTVLLLGESGVGKEMIARAIHELGLRKDQPFVAVNCGAIPENLLESELFGYVEGAFSGAKKEGMPGKFELANHGVLFLDEIGEMPLTLQVKLLRVLQEREVTPLGSSQSIPLDIQFIAATNQELEKMVKEGKFREDLYYRLNVVPIEIPSLKERVEEIPSLVTHFVQKYNELYGRKIRLTKEAIDLLSIYHWPGNVRQLENLIERIVVTAVKNKLNAASIRHMIPWKKDAVKATPIIEHIMPLQEAIDLVEEQLITMSMEQFKSVNLAAKVLGLTQPTMSRKYKKIREKLDNANLSPTNKRKILEEQLNKQLRSTAIVTAAAIQPDKIIQLKNDLLPNSKAYQALKKRLSNLKEQEGSIEYVYLFEYINDSTLRNLVADDTYPLEPGQLYKSSPDAIKSATAAMNGKVEVTNLYKDDYGIWKTCFAPIFDDSGTVIALVGYDYSKNYVDMEIRKIGKMLNVHI
ncbi:AAA family ATPase [Siminovitchia acidinfaciens]|uniref:AAA family ATPase n=1 Tax=Siminovitchia acidinfaciens TaxID=2321395 RepID=A0A429Y7Y0_9BACI|nr:sigma 54-interacting transcriptional regulator [Siminovitchia acidinfaciens]RST77488.1 AAA family ATPase [Siminovitchia acidinfaciens]